MNTNETNNVIERELSDVELDGVAGGVVIAIIAVLIG
jgi:hypothetical protein